MFLVIKFVIKDIEYVNRSHKIQNSEEARVRGNRFAGCYCLAFGWIVRNIMCKNAYHEGKVELSDSVLHSIKSVYHFIAD